MVENTRALVPPRDDARKREGKETKDSKDDRERKRIEREEEFRVKYTRAFPNWIFYFDLDSLESDTALVRKELEKTVLHMGAVSIYRIYDFRISNTFP